MGEGTEHLKAIVGMAEQDEAGLAQLIVESPLAAIASNVTVGPWMEKNNSVPLVVAHGMGDSCFNPGMQSITKASGNHLGVYSTCIPTGGNWITDTIGGFLKNMDASVEFFAKKVKAGQRLRCLRLEPGKQCDPWIHHQVQRPSCAQLYVHLRNQRWCRRIPFLHERELVPEALAACRMEQRSDCQPDLQSQLG